jgi:O-antigen ligase
VVATPPLTPRLAILLLVAAAGLPALAVAARRRHPAALAAAAFVGWAALSAGVAGTPLAWSGEYPFGTGAVFLMAVGGAWALGRRLDDVGRRGLITGVIAGALLNAGVAVIQIAADLGIRELELFHERSTGFLGNPVVLGAVAAAAVPLLAVPLPRRPLVWVPAAGLLGAATQVSGSRIALAMLLPGIGVLVATLRANRVLAAAAAVAVLAGVGVGGALAAVGADQSVAATERLASPAAGASGVSQRIEVWEAGLAAAADRPVTGFGPGRFQDGAMPHKSLRLAQLTRNVFADAHNLVVEHLVTGGIIGLGTLLTWLGLALREAWRRQNLPLLGAVVVLLVVHLFEPQNVAATPLFAALLGASSAPAVPEPALPGSARRVALLLTIPALVAGAVLLAGDARARVGVLDFDAAAAADASDLLPMWAAPVALEARIAIFDYETSGDEAALERAVALTAAAVEREPSDPATLTLRAAVLSRAGDVVAATSAWRGVLDVNPWSLPAFTALRDIWSFEQESGPADACDTLIDLVVSSVDAPAGIDEIYARCTSGP